MEKFCKQKSSTVGKRKNSVSRNHVKSENGIIPRIEIACFLQTEKFRDKKLHIFIERNDSTRQNCVRSANGIIPRIKITCSRKTELFHIKNCFYTISCANSSLLFFIEALSGLSETKSPFKSTSPLETIFTRTSRPDFTASLSSFEERS